MDKFIQKLAESLTARDCFHILLKNEIISMLINERVKNNETVQQMAHRLYVSKKKYESLESGERDFTLADISWICEKLGLVPTITFEYLRSDGGRKAQNDADS